MSGEDSTFIQAAEELTRDLVGADVQTISGLLDYLEIVDRAGFAAMVEEQVRHALHFLAEHGPTAIAVAVSHSLVLGARLGKKGLL